MSRKRLHFQGGGTLLTWGLMAILLSGCGRGDGRLAIGGDVSLDGAPVARGTINFTPVDSLKSGGSGAMVLDGKFQVSAAKGLVPGKYIVTVTTTRETGRILNEPMLGGKVPELVPVQFAEPTTREATVVSGAPNQFSFSFTSARKP